MSLIREQARGILRRLALPVPKRDRTLNVVLTNKGAIPALGDRCLCTIAANYAWRAAHENHCTKIVVHNGPNHRHQFDTIDFFKAWVVKRLGWFPAVFSINGKTPRWLATVGHRALGNELDVTRPTFTVPIAVSGSAPAAKELVTNA